MQKNSITNKITPCCGLPFSVVYWWISNLTLNSEADRQYLLTQISQNGVLSIDGWKVLVNSGTLEADASLAKPEFLAWFNCEKQPSCEQLKLIIEGYKLGVWVGDLNEIRFENVLGVLKISDPAPTTVGLYRLSEVGIYTNLGGLETTAGKINDAFFDGTSWELTDVDLKKDISTIVGELSRNYDTNIDQNGNTKHYISNAYDFDHFNFSLQKIITKKNMRLDRLDDNFNDENGATEIYTKHLNNATISFKNKCSIMSLISSNDVYLRNRNKINLPFFANRNGESIEIEIDNFDDAIIPTFGVYLSDDIFVAFCYDKNYSYSSYTDKTGTAPAGQGCVYIERRQNSYGFVTIDPVSTDNISNRRKFKTFNGKFRLILEICNDVAIVNAEQDGQYYNLAEFNISGFHFDIMKPDTYTYKWFYGCDFIGGTLTNTSSIEFTNVKIGISSGMSVGSDFKIIKSIYGEPIVEDNNVYVTGTHHSTTQLSGLGGINVYKLNISNFNLEFVGKIISRFNNLFIADASSTLLYDYENNRFIYSASKFYGAFFPVIGQSALDLREGYNVVNVQQVNFDDNYTNQTGTWDFDFYYDETAQKWKGILKSGDYFETTNPFGEWQFIQASGGFEGAAFFKINNNIRYTSCMAEVDGTLIVKDINSTVVGHLNFDTFPKKYSNSIGTMTPSWGSIFPITKNGITHYFAILFGLRFFEGKDFAYGDMWIYKTLEENNGYEF